MFAVNYHYVRTAYNYPHSGVHGLTTDQFARQAETLREAWEPVSLGALTKAVRAGSDLGERAFVVTFDDGLREQAEVALPILDQLGVPAVFFVNTSPIESGTVLPVHQIHLLRATLGSQVVWDEVRPLVLAAGFGMQDEDAYRDLAHGHYSYDSEEDARLKYLLNFVLPFQLRDEVVDECFKRHFNGREVSESLYMDRHQLREIAERGMLGAHTHRHFPVGLLPEAGAMEEVARCVGRLEEWTGVRPDALSYPYGSKEACSGFATDAAAANGIVAAFTMERAVNRTLQDPLRLARFDCNDVPGGKASRFGNDAHVPDLPSRGWFVNEGVPAL